MHATSTVTAADPMQFDLLAGVRSRPVPGRSLRPTILVFDSGLGGLTVLAALRDALPAADYVYAADDAAFPYGAWSEGALVARVVAVMERLVAAHAPDLVVIACNTASTLVLPPLRARFAIPFVGTVPAIKPAAQACRAGRIAVLATPGTVARDYTRDLIAAYAGSCRVDLVGSTRLAAYAEAELADEPVADAAISAEIAPCFSDRDGARTDVVVLACTHYPLLLHRFRRLAPWPVAWIDPAPAIARRAAALVAPLPGPATPAPDAHDATAVFTGSGALSSPLLAALATRGLTRIRSGACPLPLPS